ncbi:MAG: Asp-tRNA(Asn)/Glu-tRNA(Gln) amidotransferase GatCAB subunit A, partial [Pirellulales bacterium]|nr:Asp-tRNA(Asn)/Glu-tRNA(Gln) amidotransferase GatCAB subunit A [Pirellulales bacterium]
MQLIERSAVDLVAAIRAGDVTAVACTEAFLAQIEILNPQVNAFLSVAGSAALERASEIDDRIRSGQPIGPLAGLPVAVKDALCTADLPTTCASKMLSEYRPPYDADTVQRLRAADAVIIGKTNMDEFAMG